MNLNDLTPAQREAVTILSDRRDKWTETTVSNKAHRGIVGGRTAKALIDKGLVEGRLITTPRSDRSVTASSDWGTWKVRLTAEGLKLVDS